MDAVHRHAARAMPAEDSQVTVLGIDETRRGEPRFRYDEVVQRSEVVADTWHVGFIELLGGAGMLGQVDGRTAVNPNERTRSAPEPHLSR